MPLLCLAKASRSESLVHATLGAIDLDAPVSGAVQELDEGVCSAEWGTKQHVLFIKAPKRERYPEDGGWAFPGR